MSVLPESEELRAWVEATQSSVETWVERQEPDFAEIKASLDDEFPEELLSWMGPGLQLETPAADITDVQHRVASMLDADGAASESWVGDTTVADVRAVVERRVDSRFSPSPAAEEGTSARRVGVLPWLLAATVLAASVLGVLWIQGRPLEKSGTGGGLGQAAQLAVESAETGTSVVSDAQPEQKISHPRPALTLPPDEDEALSVVEPVSPEVPRRTPRSPSLQRLAEEAQRLWRVGDRRGAQSALMEIVRRGGRTPRVELAYADLFTLARQQGQTRKRKRLYQGYLRRFPKGRLAEDARAGLCRTGGAATQAACWRGYLQRYGSGSYRAEAKAAQ